MYIHRVLYWLSNVLIDMLFAGGSDVCDYQHIGHETDGYVGNLNLQLTNKTTNSPIYYLTVKAENAAGSFSTNITSR